MKTGINSEKSPHPAGARSLLPTIHPMAALEEREERAADSNGHLSGRVPSCAKGTSVAAAASTAARGQILL